MNVKWISIHALRAHVAVAALLLLGFNPAPVQAQGVYVLLNFMNVEDEDASAYLEGETFWSRIHRERVNSGEMLGWSLWALSPGGTSQGGQFLAVDMFDNPEAMFNDAPVMEYARRAYPDMSDEELTEKMNQTVGIRDEGSRYFLEYVGATERDFEMKPGAVAAINLVKVDQNSLEAYENAELGIFRPQHEQRIFAGKMGQWALYRVLSPTGSDAYATHITADIYEDWDQYFSDRSSEKPSFSEQMKMDRGIETVDLKWTYLARLIQMVQ